MLEAREEALRVGLKDQALLELAEVTSWRGSGRVAHLLPPSPPPLVSQHFCSQGRIKGLSTSVFKEGGKVGTCVLRSLHWEVLKKKNLLSLCEGEVSWLWESDLKWPKPCGRQNESLETLELGRTVFIHLAQVKPIRPLKRPGSSKIDELVTFVFMS